MLLAFASCAAKTKGACKSKKVLLLKQEASASKSKAKVNFI
jgi:hypothetical protein